MSTPSVTILKNLVLNWKSNQMEEETIATFYRHWDGYPSCHAIDIANSLVVASRTKPELRICNTHLRMERCFPRKRITVVLIDEDLGL